MNQEYRQQKYKEFQALFPDSKTTFEEYCEIYKIPLEFYEWAREAYKTGF